MDFNCVKSTSRDDKAALIRAHLKNGYDTQWLRHKALSKYGLVDNAIRKEVWPILSGLKLFSFSNTLNIELLEKHPQANQVELDVRRMKSMIPAGISAEETEGFIVETKRLALSILHEHPDLHYYQGFHDICFIFLSVLGPDAAFAVLNNIVQDRFSLFMQKSMNPTSEMLQLVFDLLEVTSLNIWKRLENLQLEPVFALSWLLTWFTHVLSNSQDIHRLYDLFLASDPLMLIYLSVSVIVCSTVELDATSDDFGELHHALTHLPMKHDVEKLIECAYMLYLHFNPDRLLQRAEQKRCNRHSSTPVGSQVSNILACQPIGLHFTRFVSTMSKHPGTMFISSMIVLGIGVVFKRFF